MARQVHGYIQSGLTAQRRQQRIGTLVFDNLGHNFPSQRLDVCPIRHPWVGHDCRRIRVYEDDVIALFTQRLAGLGTRIVKLTRLPDDDGPGSD